MGRTTTYDHEALADLLHIQDGAITREQALRLGLTEAAVRHRLRPDGSWQAILPGVYLAVTGRPSQRQRLMAALLYAGPASVLTGDVALVNHRLPARNPALVDVLIPAARRRRDVDFVRIQRTRRMPAAYTDRLLRFAPPVRAVADAARRMREAGEVRQLIGVAVQSGKVQVNQLAEEIDAGPEAGSALIRRVLAEVADGVRSAAEGQLRALIRRAGLPEPLYNADLFSGPAPTDFIARPDAWWPSAGVAVEVDSRAWHLSPADWERTQRRSTAMAKHGIVVLPYSPRKITSEPRVVVAEIRSALDHGRELPGIRTVPASPVRQAGPAAEHANARRPVTAPS